MTKFMNEYFHNDNLKKQAMNKWDLAKLLNTSHNFSENSSYSFIVLNTPILNPDLVLPLWNHASFKMVVDGGGNHLYSLIQQRKDEDVENFAIPNVISGDFDSVKPNVLEFYRKNDTILVHTPDQTKTDFFKALEVLVSTTKSNTVIVFCDNVGRFDHMMANINVLFKAQQDIRMEHLKILILGNNDITWLLEPGEHMIYVPKELWSEKAYCSLIPIGRPCHHVTTSGLKWNLNDGVLEFGGMVSTSNTFDTTSTENMVFISTDESLLWSMTLCSTCLPGL
ncbi:thiamin pyrophosphokinase 1-like [Planococcus citri]|uniref:thiamin pyrophosphokinase 1-like n=1 Tax=Planococcus citri TaxID=170843 RepID=UPI0031F7B5A6